MLLVVVVLPICFNSYYDLVLSHRTSFVCIHIPTELSRPNPRLTRCCKFNFKKLTYIWWFTLSTNEEKGQR